MPSERQPRTLSEAHEALRQRRPAYDAGPVAWAAFHRHCAEVYTATAKVDTRHQHEARSWAATELRQARDLEDNPPPVWRVAT
jgi:hypothetical protein